MRALADHELEAVAAGSGLFDDLLSILLGDNFQWANQVDIPSINSSRNNIAVDVPPGSTVSQNSGDISGSLIQP
jgi:hypothetical protein